MLTLNDGRSELWQWDTGRRLTVDADCSQVHFSNKVFGRSVDVDVIGGIADIPDFLLQSDKDLTAWAFVGTAENGYTKISKVFKVNKRNKPADYVFTQPEQTTLEEIKERLDDLEAIQDPDAIKNAVEDYLEQNPVESPVQSVNGQIGEVNLTAKDVGAISQNDLQEATNEALAQAKASGEFDGEPGRPGKDAPQESVLYTKQELTEKQKAQARKNIGAGSATVYRATDYGISTEAEDNTPALQSLVYRVSAAGGGIVFFPIGVYNFKPGNLTDKYPYQKTAIMMTSNVSIVGENIEKTVLKQTVATPYSMFRKMSEPDAPITGCTFSNFTVDAYDTGDVNAVHGKAFFFQYVENCVFRDLILRGTVATAMGIDFLDRVVIDNVSCIDCGRTFTGNETGTSGIGIGTAGWENENFIITNCICDGCGQYGIFIENQGLFGDGNVDYAKGCIISNCIVRNGLNKGIGVRGGENVTVIGCEVYENTSHGFYVDNNCKNVRITSCSSTKNGGNGICIEPDIASNRIIVRDCQFVDNTMEGISVNTAFQSMGLVSNYTAGNALGLKMGEITMVDCAIKGNILFDGEDVNAVFVGNNKYNEYAVLIPDIQSTSISSDMYTDGYKLNPDGSVVATDGASVVLSYIDVSALGDTFKFTFNNTSGMAVRIAQYDYNKSSLGDNFELIWYATNPTSISINKIPGCKYIRISTSSGIAVGELESVNDVQSTTIKADMYTQDKKIMPDGTLTDEAGAYSIVEYIDVSSMPNEFYLYWGTFSVDTVGVSLRIAQYAADKTSLGTSFPMVSELYAKTNVPITKIDGCQYIRIMSSSRPTEGQLVDSLPT